MPFVPEETAISRARKEAASAGYKSMTDAAMSSEDAAKADTNAARGIGEAAWGGGATDQFKEKYGVHPWEISQFYNDKVSKHLTMSPEMKKEYDAHMAKDKKAGDAGAQATASREKAKTTIAASEAGTPRRASD